MRWRARMSAREATHPADCDDLLPLTLMSPQRRSLLEHPLVAK
jgi:hypothetical protein